MQKGFKFIGTTADGLYQYEKQNGQVFQSRKKLHDDSEPIRKINEIISSDKVEETDVEELAESFGRGLKHKEGEAPGATLKNVFKQALLDVTDKNVTEEQVNDQTLKIISKLEQAGILFQVENNKGLQKKVLLNAEEKLMNEIEVSKNKQSTRLQNATYQANEFAANIYGIDSGRPKWQLALARSGANVFFMIWFIVSSITFTPIMFFLTMIGVQVKSSPLKWLFTILIYFAVIIFFYSVIARIAGYENVPLWPNKAPEAI